MKPTDKTPPEETDAAKLKTSGGRVPRLVRLLFGSKKEWDFAPFGDFWAMSISPVDAPNMLRRAIQRLLIGSKYRLIEDRPLKPIVISEPNKVISKSHEI